MHFILFFEWLVLPLYPIFATPTFKSQQLLYKRVQRAYREKEAPLRQLLITKGVKPTQLELYIRAFKHEETLEVWVRNTGSKTFTFFKQYPFCATSGVLGPKNQKGDNQTPEGFYSIDRFNPNSHFYLSLGINYPNSADRLRGKKMKLYGSALGGDVFIHGDCVTIGCIPLTNDKIKEVYVLAIEARAAGQTNIPVHIFPARFSPLNWPAMQKNFSANAALVRFWSTLKPAYDHFERTKTLPVLGLNPQGDYTLR